MSSGCIILFAAKTDEGAVRLMGFPSMSVITPPASVTRRMPAAMSQGERMNSKNRSFLPAAR